MILEKSKCPQSHQLIYREAEAKARPMFDKSEKFTYIPANRTKVNMMLANKVRGEKHFEFGSDDEVETVKTTHSIDLE